MLTVNGARQRYNGLSTNSKQIILIALVTTAAVVVGAIYYHVHLYKTVSQYDDGNFRFVCSRPLPAKLQNVRDAKTDKPKGTRYIPIDEKLSYKYCKPAGGIAS